MARKLFHLVGSGKDVLLIHPDAIDMRRLRKFQRAIGVGSKMVSPVGSGSIAAGLLTTGASTQLDIRNGVIAGAIVSMGALPVAAAGALIQGEASASLTAHIRKVGWGKVLKPSAHKEFVEQGYHRKFHPSLVDATFGRADRMGDIILGKATVLRLTPDGPPRPIPKTKKRPIRKRVIRKKKPLA